MSRIPPLLVKEMVGESRLLYIEVDFISGAFKNAKFRSVLVIYCEEIIPCYASPLCVLVGVISNVPGLAN